MVTKGGDLGTVGGGLDALCPIIIGYGGLIGERLGKVEGTGVQKSNRIMFVFSLLKKEPKKARKK